MCVSGHEQSFTARIFRVVLDDHLCNAAPCNQSSKEVAMETVGSLTLDARHVVGLIAALVFGALIGLERQLRKHPAGLHTNALVALGAAAYVIGARCRPGGDWRRFSLCGAHLARGGHRARH
jgi:hypothetical protein